jgi:hypothetical protein
MLVKGKNVLFFPPADRILSAAIGRAIPHLAGCWRRQMPELRRRQIQEILQTPDPKQSADLRDVSFRKYQHGIYMNRE